MMRNHLIRISMVLAIIISSASIANAREGDTLNPITIDAPALETSPENLLNENDARALNQRIAEARNSGVPLAVRIIDISQPRMDIPYPVRQHLPDDTNEPMSEERLQQIAQSLMESDTVESIEDANDGILLLVLVPEDRTQTQAIWWIAPNALPINGLTEENIQATHGVMNEQFANGNMPNGVFVGLLEFSYNVQFGTPERLERTTLQDALHVATIPMAILTSLAGIAIPLAALWLFRRPTESPATTGDLTPWEAAALYLGRARSTIPAAMLLDAVHKNEISPVRGGGIQISPGAKSPVVETLMPYTNGDGIMDSQAMYEIESITHPIRDGIEASLADRGAMRPTVDRDREIILIAMGIAAFLVAITTVPIVKSMSAIGVAGIAIGIVGILAGWWWLAFRRYTTDAGEELLSDWLESAGPSDRSAFDLVVHQGLLTDQDGGPEITAQTQLLRQLRGLGSA